MKKDYTNYKYIEENQVLKRALWAWMNDGSRRNVLYGADFVYRTANEIVAAMLNNRFWNDHMTAFWNLLDDKAKNAITNTIAYVRNGEIETGLSEEIGRAWEKAEGLDAFANYFDELAKQEGGDD